MAETLTEQQQQAVNDRGGKLLVSAAAGSGKTKVLVDRLMSYLTDPSDPANLDEFLIITYTKAAAAELRAKIAAKLTQKMADDPQNKHLQKQMQRLYLTKISTVHAFCADLLREFSYRLDIPRDFRVAEENECLELQMRAMEQVLEDAYATAQDDPDFCAFADTQGLGRNDMQLPDIILKVYNSARCHLDPAQWLASCEVSANVSGVSDTAQTVWGAYLLKDLQNFLELYIEALSKCASEADKAEGFEKPAALLRDTIVQLTALRNSETWQDVQHTKVIDFGRLTFSRKCSDADLAEKIKAVRSGCKEGLEKKLRSFHDDSHQVLKDLKATGSALRGLVALTKKFSDAYDKCKKMRRVLDFGDLEHRTLDLLLGIKRWGATAVANEVSKRFREVMVDEYQDSNAIQDAIFSALTDQKNNCFMVGDVKQSIYQFRLADPGIFLGKYNTYVPADQAKAGQGRKVLLSKNFRSAGPVISAVNDVFSACMTPQVGGLIYGPDEALCEGIPHTKVNEPEIELCAISVEEDTYSEEASVTADRICQLLDGKHMIRDGENLRPIRQQDIVILLRSPGSVGMEFVYALETRGVCCTMGGSMDLLHTEEITVLHSLLQVINNPLQDIPLVSVLLSRVFAFTADEIAGIRARKKRGSIYHALKLDETPKVKQFLNILDALRMESKMTNLTRLLNTILSATRIDSIYAAMSDGAEKVANIHTFLQLANEFEKRNGRDLGHFLLHLQAMEEKGIQMPGEAAADAVTIMSIHKSKGLEFPVVFLCGLSRQFNSESVRAPVLCDRELGLGLGCVDEKTRVRYPTIAKRAISVKMLSDGLSEEMRVLYVAMTRAKDRLIMTYASRYLDNDISDLALCMDICNQALMSAQVDCPGGWVLQTALRRTEAGALHALAGCTPKAKVNDIPWKISVCCADVAGDTFEEDHVQEAQLDPAQIQRIAQSLSFVYPHAEAVRTPSKLTATQIKGRSKDMEAAENTHEGLNCSNNWRRPSFLQNTVSGADYGNAVHAVMHYVDYDKCTDADMIGLELDRLVANALITPQQRELIDCNSILAFFNTPIGQKLKSSHKVIREFKFSILDDASKYSLADDAEQVLLQGVIDCALIEPDGITVIDFKTDKVTDASLETYVAQYRTQVQTYAKALSRIYQKKIKDMYLYFFRLHEAVKL